MGGGSKEVKPRFLTPPDIGSLRPDTAKYLQQLLRQLSSGQNPLYKQPGTLRQEGEQNILGQLRGQYRQGSPEEAASKQLQTDIEGGNPIDTSPLVQQARGTFERDIAPGIQERLGAQYGIRFGTPVAESLSRAGAEVSTNLNAQLLPYAESARQRQTQSSQFALGRQTGLASQAAALGEETRMGEQNALMQGIQALLSGVGGLSSQGSFASPSFAPSQGQQNWQTAAQFAAALAAIFGGCWIAEAIYGKDTYETWQLRLYLNTDFGHRWYGRPIMALYRRFGRRIATWPWAVRLLKPLFTFALKRAPALGT